MQREMQLFANFAAYEQHELCRKVSAANAPGNQSQRRNGTQQSLQRSAIIKYFSDSVEKSNALEKSKLIASIDM